MKALILAAGLGTRLLPHTHIVPKPLFPVGGVPLVERIIQNLIAAGASAVVLNTHHLHEKISSYIQSRKYSIPVTTVYEPEIMGTGGAMKNLSNFWDDAPFIVINGDVETDIHLKALYEFHMGHKSPVTMVLHDYPDINTVAVENDGGILGFGKHDFPGKMMRTFTGIQVVNPEILDLIPHAGFSSSIDAYKSLISRGKPPMAYMPEMTWHDIGTADRYVDAAIDAHSLRFFEKELGIQKPDVEITRLKGDGSDRIWKRAKVETRYSIMSTIIAAHGVHSTPMGDVATEFDAFVNIGSHLKHKGIPVPEIYFHERFSGLVFLQDLGNTHFQDVAASVKSAGEMKDLYHQAIDIMIGMSVNAVDGFDPAWTCQTPTYSRELIMERECRYFWNAFLKGHLSIDLDFEKYEGEFQDLSAMAVNNGINGLMHRDFQSRNIMVKNGRLYLIDFQGARIGPIQYDLASLIIDPYVNLPFDARDNLAIYALEKLKKYKKVDEGIFFRGLAACRVTRNLQALGAYGFLSGVKGKADFITYIPAAMKSLKHNINTLNAMENGRFEKLVSLVEQAGNV